MSVPGSSASADISLSLDSLVASGLDTTPQGLIFNALPVTVRAKPSAPEGLEFGDGKLKKLTLRQGTAFVEKGSQYRNIGSSGFPSLRRGAVYFVEVSELPETRG